jgi:hypothetical protein
MNEGLAEIWQQISPEEKRFVFKEIATDMNLPPAAIEKDWWVVRTLELVFQTETTPGEDKGGPPEQAFV